MAYEKTTLNKNWLEKWGSRQLTNRAWKRKRHIPIKLISLEKEHAEMETFILTAMESYAEDTQDKIRHNHSETGKKQILENECKKILNTPYHTTVGAWETGLPKKKQKSRHKEKI